MAKTETSGDELRRGDKVVAAIDMPGVPAGTPGKVAFLDGFSWIRYWVRFANGELRGTLHRNKLARPKEWQDLLARRAAGIEEPTAATKEDAAAPAEAEGGDDGGGAGSSRVPAHLLERSKKARERLATSA